MAAAPGPSSAPRSSRVKSANLWELSYKNLEDFDPASPNIYRIREERTLEVTQQLLLTWGIPILSIAFSPAWYLGWNFISFGVGVVASIVLCKLLFSIWERNRFIDLGPDYICVGRTRLDYASITMINVYRERKVTEYIIGQRAGLVYMQGGNWIADATGTGVVREIYIETRDNPYLLCSQLDTYHISKEDLIELLARRIVMGRGNADLWTRLVKNVTKRFSSK